MIERKSYLGALLIIFISLLLPLGLYADEETITDTNISYETIVGRDFFTKEGGKFLNLSGADLAIQPDYIIKAEDVLVIDVWGELDLHYSLTVDSNGAIVVPQVGKVDLRGLTFAESKKKILNKFADTYSFYIDPSDPGAGKAHIDITMGKVSGVKVYLTGEVVHPGVVILNGLNSTVIAAISAGGGLKSAGSVRNIQVTHPDGTKTDFDLYDFLIKGKLSLGNKYLNEGDIINVPPLKDKAFILGAVINPGIYEIKPGEKVASLIELAGGFESSASGDLVISNAVEDVYDTNTQKETVTGSFSSLENHIAVNNDIILAKEKLSFKPYSFVKIIGNGARFNGKLRYKKGLTLADCISKAGGLYRDVYKNIIVGSTREDGAVFFRMVNTLDALAGNKDENISLLPGDEVYIFDTQEIFNKNYAVIEGYFKHPQILEVKEGERLSYLIDKGEPRTDADLEAGQFTHDGKSIMVNIQAVLDKPEIKSNYSLGKFDTLTLLKMPVFNEVSDIVTDSGVVTENDAKYKPYSYVEITGNGVRYNGRLRLQKGMAVSSVINKVGGLYRDAYKNIILRRVNEDGAVFYYLLDSSKVISGDKDSDMALCPNDVIIVWDNNDLYNNNYAIVEGYVECPQIVSLKENLRISDLINIGKPLPNGDIENAVFTHDGKNVLLNLKEIIDNPSSRMNFRVSRFDQILIPKSQPYVAVSGTVLSPGFYPYAEGKTAGYYIELAGGFTDNAARYKTTVTDQAGRIERAYYWLWLFDPEVKRGASISVPEAK